MRTDQRQDETSLRQLVIRDFRQLGWARSFRQDLRDLQDFYLTEEERARLAQVGGLKWMLRVTLWLFKKLLLRLSPARRVLIVLALVLALLNKRFTYKQFTVDLNTWFVSVAILLFVLMLELKDKLLARDEIELAREVQVSLLPRSHPEIKGWSVWCVSRPANDVGGDLVDYIQGADGRLGIVLGDVAGKGMAAALLAARLQVVLRTLAPEAITLSALGQRANLIFLNDRIENRYATLFFAEIAPDDGRVRTLNAGHNPAFLVRDGDVTMLTASSYPIGMLPQARYEEGLVELSQGDVLLLYSDGLTEALNPAGEEFGEERLRKTILASKSFPLDEIGQRILEEVGLFAAGAKPHDDQSLVVIRRERAS